MQPLTVNETMTKFKRSGVVDAKESLKTQTFELSQLLLLLLFALTVSGFLKCTRQVSKLAVATDSAPLDYGCGKSLV
jgi:di/tricarboxylate transporter